jgi:RND family efflux transporter MFP subunit
MRAGRHKHFTVGGAALFIVALLLPLAATAQGQNAAPPPAPVAVELAQMRLLAPVTWYPGTVISRNKARLSAEVAGRLRRVAEVGANLKQGDAVAHIDDTLLKQTLEEHKAAVARERARLKFLNAEVKRLEKLAKQNTATQSQLEEAVANLGVTRSELAASQARVRLTRERLERTTLRAPFSGVVVERLLEPGEWADEGAAVVRLVDPQSLDVQTWVPVQALKFLSADSELRLQANPNNATGKVHTIVPVGDGQSRLYELRLEIEETVWPVGQDLRVAVPTAAPQEVVAINRDALVLRRDGTVVYRINDQNTAERVPVKTGIASGKFIEVTGIRAGDRVVIRGGERLRPGQKVTIASQDGVQ